MQPHRRRGRAIGALFFAGFGALWLYGGLTMLGLATPTVLVALVLGAAALAGAAWRIVRQPLPTPMDPEVQRVVNRWFMRVNIAQWVAIAVAVLALNLLARTDLVPLAISVIVALHFLPLARVFRERTHVVIAAALLALDAAALLWSPPGQSAPAVMLGTGAILWAGAAWQVAPSLGQGALPA